MSGHQFRSTDDVGPELGLIKAPSFEDACRDLAALRSAANETNRILERIFGAVTAVAFALLVLLAYEVGLIAKVIAWAGLGAAP